MADSAVQTSDELMEVIAELNELIKQSQKTDTVIVSHGKYSELHHKILVQAIDNEYSKMGLMPPNTTNSFVTFDEFLDEWKECESKNSYGVVRVEDSEKHLKKLIKHAKTPMERKMHEKQLNALYKKRKKK